MTLRARLFTSLAFLAALTAACGPTSSSSSTASAPAVPAVTEAVQGGIRLVRAESERLLIEITVPHPELKETTLAGEKHWQLAVGGFANGGAPGAPSLPVERALIAVPEGKVATLELVDQTVLQETKLDAPVAFVEAHAALPASTVMSLEAYAAASNQPRVTLETTSHMGAARVSRLVVRPVSYDVANKRLSWASVVTAIVRFTPAPASAATPAPHASLAIARSLVLNPEALRQTPPAAGNVDLILAHESYRATLAPLIRFKEGRGREVRTRYFTNATAASVTEAIGAEYRATRAPTHVILVGSIDQIPSHRVDGIWSDYAYTQLDGGGVPDVSLGRIPAQTPAELAVYVRKVMSRTTATRDSNRFLLTAGNDTGFGCPQNVARVGELVSQYRSSVQSTQLYMADGATRDEVFEAYNANPNVVIYDGHGDRLGMSEIPLEIDDLPSFTNTVYPIILDIACENARWPSTGATVRNFAESTLLIDGRGAAGIVAAGGFSGGHEFFQRMGTSMGRDAQDPVLGEIGSVVHAAKSIAGDEDNYMFGYYGDPSLTTF